MKSQQNRIELVTRPGRETKWLFFCKNSRYGEWRFRKEKAPIALGEPDPDRSIHPDIATQLVKGEVGRKTNVVLGGGLRSFKP